MMSLLLLGVLFLGYVAGFVSGRMLIGPKVQLTVENIAENVNIPKEINYIQCCKYMKVLFMSHYDGFDFLVLCALCLWGYDRVGSDMWIGSYMHHMVQVQ